MLTNFIAEDGQGIKEIRNAIVSIAKSPLRPGREWEAEKYCGDTPVKSLGHVIDIF